MIDPERIVKRVEDAVQRAGAGAWLIGYDINSIQDLVTASNRPITMRGASQTIKDFDKASCESTASISVFAGGGRGVELALSETAARDRVAGLQADFRRDSHSGVLAADAVPYRRDLPAASLGWLRRKLELAKDAAIRPGGKLPRNKEGQCEDCCALHAERKIRVGDDERTVCARCFLFIEKSRSLSSKEMSQSLLEFASHGRIAAISADGNNFGSFFGSLGSLQQLAVASEAVADIFGEAIHEASLRIAPRRVLAPVTGGDDIRGFLAPEGVLAYVEALVGIVESRAASAGDLGGVLSPLQAQAFSQIGVGIGAVVAGDHYPASRLMEYAHELERLSKKNRHATGGARSVFDFVVLTSGEDQRGADRPAPISMARDAWKQTLHNATALRKIPTAQRAVLAERPRALSPQASPAEIENLEGAQLSFESLLLYQVARSSKWKEWFRECGVDWTNRTALCNHVRDVRIDLLDLLPSEDRGA